jgi:hypothetical protein
VTEVYWAGFVGGFLWANVAWICGLMVAGGVREVRRRKTDDREGR